MQSDLRGKVRNKPPPIPTMGQQPRTASERGFRLPP